MFDMFVSGKAGRKAPFTLKVLTQMQLSHILLTSKDIIKNNNSIVIKGLFISLFADAPKAYQFGFQEPASNVMEGIIDLHHDIMFFII